MRRCCSEACIAGDERDVQGFGQRDEDRVVCGQVVTQLPGPIGERLVRVPEDRQVGEVGPRILCTVGGQGAREREPPQRVEHLDVDQVGCVQNSIAGKTLDECRWGRPTGDHLEHGGGVDDEHEPLSRPIAAGTDGLDDRHAVGASGPLPRAAQHLADGGALGDALELGVYGTQITPTAGGHGRRRIGPWSSDHKQEDRSGGRVPVSVEGVDANRHWAHRGVWARLSVPSRA